MAVEATDVIRPKAANGVGRRIIRRLLPTATRRALRRWVGSEPSRNELLRIRRAWLRPGEPEGLARIQVGCGPTTLLDDWWNVDIRDFPGVDEVADATGPWPWRNLEYVYGEHFLEHLPLDGAIRFVREAAVALKPGGILRLSTPSLEHVWVTHFDPAPGRSVEAVISDTYRANRAFHGWGHQFLYSREMLERLLAAAGFVDVSFHAYGQSDVAALRNVERHPGWDIQAGWPSVWIVEGTAGGTPLALPALTDQAESEFIRYVRSGH